MAYIRARVPGVVALAAAIGFASAGVASASSSQPDPWSTHKSTIAPVLGHAAAPRPGTALNSVAPIGLNSVTYTGKAFDSCSAPTEAQMAAWKQSSPYDAIGINIGGENRACAQPNLTPRWVHDEAAAGWHFFLLYAGAQAPGTVCTTCTTMSTTDPTDQAAAAAANAVDQAAALGFQPGTPIFYDLRDYADGGSNSATVLSFLSSWGGFTSQYGYPGGAHGAMGSAVKDLVANYPNDGDFYFLDYASGNGKLTTSDPSIPPADFSYHERINEYAFSHSETWGGTALTVDSDYMDIQPWQTAGGNASLSAIGADGTVMEWLGGDKWFDLGAKPAHLIIGNDRQYAVFPNGEGIFTYDAGTGTWMRIGGPGAQFTTGNGSLYGLNSSRSQILMWNGTTGAGSAWTPVGGPASAIYGGLAGLLATNPSNTGVYFLGQDMTWQRIGGGGAQFAETWVSVDTGPAIVGLTPNHSGVFLWSGKGTSWTQIGGAAQAIYVDANGTSDERYLYATSPGDKAVYGYENIPGEWVQVGGAGAQFANCWGMLFGLSSVGGSVYRYDGSVWQNVGGPISSIQCMDSP